MKRVAISGANGFVGHTLCNLLAQNKDEYEIIPIDITTGIDLSIKEACEQIEKFDVFVHLANLVYVPDSYKNPEKFYRINYMTTLNALELCRKYNGRLVYISSYIYGSPQYLPVDEKHSINPFNPYAQTKVICESLCEGYVRDFNIPVTILRPFNIYGNGQKGSLLIPEIIQQLKEHKDTIQLRDPHPRRDYINVKDIASALKACVDVDHNGIRRYNLCSGTSYSVLELTEIINSFLPKPVKFAFSKSDRVNEVDETIGTYDKIKNELGWHPSIDFKQGIYNLLKFENII